MLRFIQDEDGDLGFSMFWGLVTFVKYKDSVLVYWFQKYGPAPKYL